jgi:hypothetical protein
MGYCSGQAKITEIRDICPFTGIIQSPESSGKANGKKNKYMLYPPMSPSCVPV